MKKIVGILTVAAMATSMFAADVAARVVMEGSLAGGDKNSTYVWQLNQKEQKDADAAIIEVNGDKAGAKFQLWYKYTGADADLKVRSTSLWFKPVDSVKVTLGDVSSGPWFGNTLDYWKNPVGSSAAAYNSWVARYSSYATVEGAGIMVEVTPVEGLTINGGITAGTDKDNKKHFFEKAGDTTKVAKYGIGAMYNIPNIPLTIGATYRDEGKGADKLVSVGAKYGNAYSDPFHTSINARMRFENKKMAGVTIDNYFKYASGALNACLRAPVTIRLGDDSSYMSFSGKVSYAVEGYVPYFMFGSDLDNNDATLLDKFADTLSLQFQPGVTFNVGACSLDVGARINKAANNSISWSIPFTAAVTF